MSVQLDAILPVPLILQSTPISMSYMNYITIIW